MKLPKTPSFSLDGKRALVTGASSGIGLAAAVSLAEAGARVTLAARSKGKLSDLVVAFGAEGWEATAGSRLSILEGFVGHAEQCNLRVRRYGGKDVPYGAAAE